MLSSGAQTPPPLSLADHDPPLVPPEHVLALQLHVHQKKRASLALLTSFHERPVQFPRRDIRRASAAPLILNSIPPASACWFTPQSQISPQHADCADGTSYDGSEKRFFRGTLESCRQASEFWKQLGARDAIHLG